MLLREANKAVGVTFASETRLDRGIEVLQSAAIRFRVLKQPKCFLTDDLAHRALEAAIDHERTNQATYTYRNSIGRYHCECRREVNSDFPREYVRRLAFRPFCFIDIIVYKAAASGSVIRSMFLIPAFLAA